MVIYEITAAVRSDLIKKYEEYMRKRHIPDLLATGYFSGAYFMRSKENRYRIQYLAHDQTALDNYLKNDAEQLRADFLAHFSEGVEIIREIWSVLEAWEETPPSAG